MNLTQLIERTRFLIDDTEEPKHTTDVQLCDFLNEAEREAAYRARLLFETSRDALNRSTTKIDEPTYDVCDEVIYINRLMLVGQARPMWRTDVDTMDMCRYDWEDATGLPTHYIFDVETSTLRLFPIPDAEHTFRARFWRYPCRPMLNGTDEPEIAVHWHQYLPHWAAMRALDRPDEDHHQPGLADKNRFEFENQFGPRTNAVAYNVREDWSGITPRDYYV